MTPPLLVRCAAEVCGTALLVGLGTGAIVAGADVGGVPQWVLAVAWFFAVLIPILAFAFVSGSHINPAVTLALVTSRGFAPRDALPYIAAQVAGAFAGSVVVAAVLGTADHLGATLPHHIGLTGVFLLEYFFTLCLILGVLFLTRPREIVRRWELLLPPATVAIATFVIGPWTGSSLNPARTLAPDVLAGVYTGIGVYVAATVAAALSGSLLLRLWHRRMARGSPGRGGTRSP